MLTRYVPETNRLYVRRFDHEEAARRYWAGETQTALAREYGVTPKAVRQAIARLRPEVRERDTARKRAWRATTCEGCGAPAVKRKHNPDGRVLCVSCRGKTRRKRLRYSADGVLLLECPGCGEWKPLAEHLPRTRRRLAEGKAAGPSYCHSCVARQRQAYRLRHRVPCERCGAPCLAPTEKGRRGRPGRSLCLACFRETEWPDAGRRGVAISAARRRKRGRAA